MTIDEPDWKMNYRLALLESMKFLGRDGKFERECWVVARLLRALSIDFDESLFREGDEPVDVLFREARLQIKELMDPHRRRGDELKQSLINLDSADSRADLTELYEPKDIAFADVVEHTVRKADELEAKVYGPSEVRNLDLLCYFNFLDYDVIHPLTTSTIQTNFRSISVVTNTFCGVIFAAPNAPIFLRQNVGIVCDPLVVKID